MDDDSVLAKPVVVVGSARSGTTMLGELLEVHSSLFGIIEPRFTWRYGNDKKSDMLRADDARPEVIAYIRQQFACQVRESGRVRLLEKTPSNALRLDFVDRVFPDCKIIHIIRNGVDASLSIRSYWNQAAHGIKGVNPGKLSQRLKELQWHRIPSYATEALRRFAPWPLSRLVGPNVWGPRIPGIQGMLKELELLEICALQWRTCVEAARHCGARMPADRYMEIKLEEMTLEKFRTLLAFAELREEPALIDNFRQTVDPARSTARRSHASAADVQVLDKWIGPTMEWLGYSIPSTTELTTSSDNRVSDSPGETRPIRMED